MYPGWLPQTPIPGVSLSAGGLLALAELSTAAQRTALKGGSSWLDSLLLVPGLHYQQAADELARKTGLPPALSAVELRPDGSRVPFSVNNAAVSQFCQRVARDAELVTLEVGPLPPRGRRRQGGRSPRLLTNARKHRRRSGLGDDEIEAADDDHDVDPNELEIPDLGWLSHLFYLMGPLLTLTAIVLLVLIHDCKQQKNQPDIARYILGLMFTDNNTLFSPGWALGCICALIFSRVLNIWVIKQRVARKAAPAPHPPPPEAAGASPSRHPSSTTSSSATAASQLHRQQRRRSRQQAGSAGSAQSPATALVSLLVALPDGREVRLRGTAPDLAAAAGSAWLRAETHVEGYLEAAAKLCVYLVAAVSGNWTQAGALVVMALLLASAALLALSNAHATRLDVAGGYVAVPGGRRGKRMTMHTHAATGGERQEFAAGDGGAGLAAGYGAVEHGGVMGQRQQQQQARREGIDDDHDFVGGGHSAGGAGGGGGWPIITADSSSTGGVYDWAESGPSVAGHKDEGVKGYNQGS